MVQTAVVWPDACPIYMPKADLVIVLRDEMSAKPGDDHAREITVLPWSDIESVGSGYQYESDGGFYRMDYDIALPSVQDFVRSIPLIAHDPQSGLGADSVLNLELVKEFS